MIDIDKELWISINHKVELHGKEYNSLALLPDEDYQRVRSDFVNSKLFTGEWLEIDGEYVDSTDVELGLNEPLDFTGETEGDR